MKQTSSAAIPRIAVAGISIECSTFSPAETNYEDFSHYRGDEIIRIFPFLNDVPGVVPLQWSRSIPGAPVTRDAYDRIKTEILSLAADNSNLSGLYLIMHGAMSVAGMEDAEGDFVAAVREVVGDACMVVASYDLHGNLSNRIFDQIDLITAYRHAPHIDSEETRRRGFALMRRCLKLEKPPEKSYVRLPMLLPGEKTSTEWEPAKSLYRELDSVAEIPGIIDASILVGYAWADESRSGASVVVYGESRDAVKKLSSDLAAKFWGLRFQFDFGVFAGSFTECLDLARDDNAAGLRPVIISDSGDNPTAGGAGDVTHGLAKILESAEEGLVYASIADSSAVDRCFTARVGDPIGLIVGGKLDSIHGQPLALHGTIETLSDADPWNRKVVIERDGIRVIITEHRTPFHHVDQFRELNIEPGKCRILAVKIGYLVPELKLLAKKSYLALSPGAVNQDIINLPYKRVERPIFPLDEIDAVPDLVGK